MSVNLRDLTREFFAGTLEGEDDKTRKILNESCGCGSAPDSSPDLPQFIDIDPIGGGVMGHGAMSHDSVADENLIADLDRIASGMHGDGGGCLTSIVSALSQMMSEGVSPSDARAVWDALFTIAQGSEDSAY